MKKSFDESCAGCLNHDILSKFANDCEALEDAVKKEGNMELVQEGRAACPGRVEVGQKCHTCRAERPRAPRVEVIAKRAGELSVVVETQILGMPDLMGMEVLGGGHYIHENDL
jgi:hypothetical protein